MLYVLYQSSGCHSGRALRKELAQELGEPVGGGFPSRFKKSLQKGNAPHAVINLGTTDDYDYEGPLMNSQAMVRSAANKRQARITFQEQEVAAPALYLEVKDIPKRGGYPVIGRTSYHSKGRGFWFCRNVTEARSAKRAGATHFLEFIPGAREYRVHVFVKTGHMDKPSEERKPEHFISAKISEKVWEGRGKAPEKDQLQKNHAFGWTFLGPQDRDEGELGVVRHTAKVAMASLGLDFGAVDIMFRLRNKRPFTLEINSTPSLADEQADTCQRYAARLLKMIEAGGK